MAIDVKSLISLLQDDGSPEHWQRTLPIYGDHIRVRRLGGLYYHHGIYLSDEEVITFAGDDDYNPIDWWDTKIRSTDLREFLQGGELEVRRYTQAEQSKLCSPEETAAFARACVGNEKYNLLFHNCEHFCNAAKLGVYRSRQAEDFLFGDALAKAGECLGDKEKRAAWFQDALHDLAGQVLDKIQRDREQKE